MRLEVEFTTEDGTMLGGYLHMPERGSGPGIVMAHGFSGVREQIDHYAAAFAAAGFSVLLYDHRGFGSSEGLPRVELDPMRQLADWRDAITYALTRPEFQGPGIGAWGSSFAGGLAMVLAANDHRVRCVVAQIPNVSGHRNAHQTFNVTERAQLRRMFEADRRSRLEGGDPATIAVFTSDADQLSVIRPPVSANYIKAVAASTPSWSNQVTLRSLENSIDFEPAGWVPYISPTPLLMIVGARDTCTFPDLQLDVYATANEPKKLLIHQGGHFDTYSDHFIETSKAAVDLFTEHLTATEPQTRRQSLPAS